RPGDGQVGTVPGVELPDGKTVGRFQVESGGADDGGPGVGEGALAVALQDGHVVVIAGVGGAVGDREVEFAVPVEVGGHDGRRAGAGGEVGAGGEADVAESAVVEEDRDVAACAVGDCDVLPVVIVEVAHGQSRRPGGAGRQGQRECRGHGETAGELALKD